VNPAGSPPRYVVRWSDEAMEELASAVFKYFDRGQARRVTQSERILNLLLADDPLRNGMSLSEGLCQITVSPLRAYYRWTPSRTSCT
jgi:hypothetical protein